MNYSLITDIDGTLLKKAEIPPLLVRQSLENFVAQGNHLSVCTGRALQGCTNLISHLPPTTSASIFFGGALIWDIEKRREVVSTSCDPTIFDVAQKILATYPSVSITMNSRDEAWTLRTNTTLQTKGTLYDRETPVVASAPSRSKKILKVLLTSANPLEIEEIKETLLDPHLFHGTFASTHFFEITDKTVHKGTAIKSLLDISKELRKCETWGAGDALSDLAMKEYVDYFACPEDAHKQLLATADYIFPSAKDAGITHLIDHILFK